MLIGGSEDIDKSQQKVNHIMLEDFIMLLNKLMEHDVKFSSSF